MHRPGSPHLITTYNEREQVTPREHNIRVPAILCSKDEEGVKGCRVAGAVNNYTSQLLTYSSSSQSPSCKSSRQYNLTEALLFLSHIMGDIHKNEQVGRSIGASYTVIAVLPDVNIFFVVKLM
ncbi:hypothetical protein ACQJBY_014389 [Aegilops geniculata]